MVEAVLRAPLPIKALPYMALCAAVLIYAVAGTPTPERLGPAEVMIAALIVFAVGLPQAARALVPGQGNGWQKSGAVLLLFGLSVPVVNGFLMGNSVSGIMRDILPFFFLLLPVFLQSAWLAQERQIKILTALVVILGLVFSLRVLLPAYFNLAGLQPSSVPDPLRLANAPTVLFAALLLSGLSGLYLYRGDLFKSALCALLCVIPLMTVALITQRASIGAFCLSGLVLFMIGAVRRPYRVLLPLLMISCVVAVYWQPIDEIIHSLLRKSSMVGFNMRGQEAQVVRDAVGGSLWTVLFGKGWGATIASPAVGGAVVNFTHSLPTMYWLKTGLVGVCIVLVYLARLGALLVPLFFRNPVVALALAGPFLIDIFLYASFKSLDFGLILLLISLWAGRSDSLHRTPIYSIQK
ncbi:MAG: hypothetical protein H6867_04565 [Rhodospirillales bacterium]|nr:hypothetical protein [Rhodospirillales bacterium]MCB9996423.1 hypothetical protein [Rhodospirillales bacterium]